MKLIPIKTVRKIPFKGSVYDLTVNEDSSYTTNGVIVHNSPCTTRVICGHGMPQVTMLAAIRLWRDAFARDNKLSYHDTPKVIADGGIRTSGDAVKAFALGADWVMLGGLLAGWKESPGEILWREGHPFKEYRGMASVTAQINREEGIRSKEGTSTLVRLKTTECYELKDFLIDFTFGIKSGLSYSGARTLRELLNNAQIYQVTTAGLVEGRPHILFNTN